MIYNEEINAARLRLISAVREFKEFTNSYSDEDIVRMLIAVLSVPGSLTYPGNDHALWDAVRQRLRRL